MPLSDRHYYGQRRPLRHDPHLDSAERPLWKLHLLHYPWLKSLVAVLVR